MHLPQIFRADTWFSVSVGLFGVLFVAWKLWRKPLKQIAGSLRQLLRGWGSSWRKTTRGDTNWRAVLFVTFCCACLIWAGHRLDTAPVVEKYNVQVLKRVGLNKWAMSDDQGPFLYTACDDFPNATVIWAGYIARKVRWQEFGSCKSIRRQDLGFWWDRDENYNAKEIQP